ncbi:MAG TPA: arabinofuranosidase catalytic domain-containing protein, partial [Polyangiaceae bacterium]|nr:arabinofuranosidase catalytic domain-containing protein [Polyangiaceae bacterium]
MAARVIATNNLRSVAFAAIPVSLGALAFACWDYSAGDPLAALPTAGSTNTPSGGSSSAASGGTSGSGSGSANSAPLPCDILEGAGLACVSAHSTVRVVVPGYAGPLYQVERPDGTTLDIGSVGGYGDAAAQDAFCTGGCVISVVYDQSSMGNHLTQAPPGSAKPTPGNPVNAGALSVSINGRTAYGILIRPGMGYR